MDTIKRFSQPNKFGDKHEFRYPLRCEKNVPKRLPNWCVHCGGEMGADKKDGGWWNDGMLDRWCHQTGWYYEQPKHN